MTRRAAAGLLWLAGVFLAVPAVLAQEVALIEFEGPDVAHVNYQCWAKHPSAGNVTMDVIAKVNGAEQLLSTEATIFVSGPFRVTGLSGLSEFSIFVRERFGTPQSLEDHSEVVFPHANQVAGWARFDEVIQGDLETVLRDMTVYDRSVTLRGIGRASVPNWVDVAGSLVIEECGFTNNFVRFMGSPPPATASLTIRKSALAGSFDGTYDSFVAEGSILGIEALGAARSVSMSDCEITGATVLIGDGAETMTFSGNVFGGALRLRIKTPPSPIAVSLGGNSFLGIEGVSIENDYGVPIGDPSVLEDFSLGGAYWGSTRGPSHPASPSGWLSGGGAVCDQFDGDTSFLRSGKKKAAPECPDEWRPVPPVWVAEWQVGQNVLGGACRAERDLLVAFDVRAASGGISPAYWLTWNGETIQPDDSRFETRRDYGVPSSSTFTRWRTLNFIVPASKVLPPGAAYHLWVDTTRLGLCGGGVTSLVSYSQIVAPAPGRPLRIGVMPVHVDLSGFTVREPSGSAVGSAINRLNSDLPAIWPIRANELRIEQIPLYRYEGGYFGRFWVGLTTAGFVNNLATELSTCFLANYNAALPLDRRLDLLVAVLPGNALGGPDGANLALRRNVALVDEWSTDAVAHELGHALGLYTGNDQYEFATGLDAYGNYIRNKRGAVLDGHTAFIPEAGLAHPVVTDRIRHFPFDPAYLNLHDVYDVMGGPGPFWIVPSTQGAVYSALAGLLGTKQAPDGDAKGAGPAATPKAEGDGRRVQFTGMWQRIPAPGAPGEWTFDILPETIACREVTGTGIESYRDYDEEFHDSVTYLTCYDAASMPITNRLCTWAGTTNSETLPWLQIMDLPTNTHDYTIWTEHSGNIKFQLPDPGGAMSNRLDVSVVGAGTGALFTLDWTCTSTGGRGGTADTARASDFLPQHQLYYRQEGRPDWTAIGGSAVGTSLRIPAASLGASSGIDFRLLSSDGFRHAESVVVGFSAANQRPSCFIVQPVDGAEAPTGSVWALTATARDGEDGDLTNGTWTSSLQGFLMSGLAGAAVLAAPGNHVLTFEAVDSGGLEVSASVTVRVHAAAAGVDLSIPESALLVRPFDADPARARGNRPQVGQTNRVVLTLANQGYTNGATIELRYAPPGGAEQVLAQTTVSNWEPFASAVLETSVVAGVRGVYRFRGRILSPQLPDPVPANNDRTWAFSNAPPEALGMRVEVGNMADGQLRLQGFDVDGDPLTWEIVSGPSNGTLTVTGAPPDYVYRSDNFIGSDSIAYRVSDGWSASGIATVDVRVTGRILPVPDIQDSGLIFADYGYPFYRQIVATREPTNYWAVGLPTGLSMNPVSGVITGTPSVKGYFPVTLFAQNANGAGSRRVTFHTVYAPFIIMSSGTHTNAVGESSQLWAMGSGTQPIHYQWYRGDMGETNTPVGGDSYFYDTPPLTGPASYWCRVYSEFGAATSETVRIFIGTLPPVILGWPYAEGNWLTPFAYEIDARYAPTFYEARDLPDWLALQGHTLAGTPLTGGVWTVTVVAGNSAGAATGSVEITIRDAPVLTWTNRASGSALRLYGAAFGSGRYVAVGELGTVLTSDNGATWTSRTSGTSADFLTVAYGNGRFVAGGNSGVIRTSTNGVSWSAAASGLGTPINGISWVNGIFVGSSYNLSIITSGAGTNWTTRKSGGSNPLCSSAFINGLYVVVGGMGWGSPTVYTSPDLSTWTWCDTGAAQDGFFGAAADGAAVAAVGKAGKAMTSPDGTNWVLRASGVTRDLEAVCQGEGTFVAAGASGTLLASRTGAGWLAQSSGTSQNLHGVAYGAGLFVAVGDNGTILTAPWDPDVDGDGMTLSQERTAGTSPTDRLSVLRMNAPPRPGGSGFVIGWESVTGRTYRVMRAGSMPALPSFSDVSGPLAGRLPSMTYTDAPPAGLPAFYRVRVDGP